MNAEQEKTISGMRKWFLDLWADMCRALWRTAFEEYNIWRADKLVVKGGTTDEQLDKSVDDSGIMGLPLPE